MKKLTDKMRITYVKYMVKKYKNVDKIIESEMTIEKFYKTKGNENEIF